MDDPYQLLGVARDATNDDICSAYRKLAKQYHPDLNPGNATAEARFKEISCANGILSDPGKRAQFDRDEIDASGQAQAAHASYSDYAGGEAGRGYSRADPQENGWSNDDLGDMFGSLFNPGQRSAQNGPVRGADEHYALDAAFIDAVTGADRRLTLPDGRILGVKIPLGLTLGQVLRLRGQGHPGWNGGPSGDALLEIYVAPHAYFTRDAQNIRIELPVSLSEAVLGGMVEVPTPSGPVRMRIPAGSDSATELRLRGKGVARHANHEAGDLYARLRVQIGPSDAALDTFLRDWQPEHARDPRQSLKEPS